MTFRIEALPEAAFRPLFALSDAELAARQARRMIAAESACLPCRVSLEEARPGDEVILLHYQHQPGDSPYRAAHAIFVRKGARQARLDVGEVPRLLRTRLISLRGFDRDHDIVDAEVVPGTALEPAIERMLESQSVAYLHLHNAKEGCYHAKALRA